MKSDTAPESEAPKAPDAVEERRAFLRRAAGVAVAAPAATLLLAAASKRADAFPSCNNYVPC